MINGELAGPPIWQTLGFKPIVADEGTVTFEGAPEFSTMNPIGTVHGGWYGTILDSCMACAVQTMLKPGQIHTTLEYKINILRPIPVGMTVHAVGTVQHVGRSTGLSVGEVRGVEDGKLYACLLDSSDAADDGLSGDLWYPRNTTDTKQRRERD